MGDDGRMGRNLSDSPGYEFPKETVLAGERFVEGLRNGRITMERLRDASMEPNPMTGAQEVSSFQRFLDSEESRVMRLVCDCSDARGR